jgi:hypothetical protein
MLCDLHVKDLAQTVPSASGTPHCLSTSTTVWPLDLFAELPVAGFPDALVLFFFSFFLVLCCMIDESESSSAVLSFVALSFDSFLDALADFFEGGGSSVTELAGESASRGPVSSLTLRFRTTAVGPVVVGCFLQSAVWYGNAHFKSGRRQLAHSAYSRFDSRGFADVKTVLSHLVNCGAAVDLT